MFNLNFKKLLFNGIWNSGDTQTSPPQFEKETQVTNISGQTVTVGDASNFSIAQYWINTVIHALNRISTNASNANVGQSYFKLGTGSTTPTEEDYNIETEASTLVINQITQVTTATYEKVYNLNITNTGAAAITLSEIVHVLRLYNSTDVAISRTAAAITFAPGQTKTIMVEVSL